MIKECKLFQVNCLPSQNKLLKHFPLFVCRTIKSPPSRTFWRCQRAKNRTRNSMCFFFGEQLWHSLAASAIAENAQAASPLSVNASGVIAKVCGQLKRPLFQSPLYTCILFQIRAHSQHTNGDHQQTIHLLVISVTINPRSPSKVRRCVGHVSMRHPGLRLFDHTAIYYSGA